MQVTAGVIIADARLRAGADGLDYRHTTADMLRLLSASVGGLWALVSTHADRLFSSFVAGTIPTTPTLAGENYCQIPLPNNVESIQRIEVLRSNRWVPLRRAQFSDAPDEFPTIGPNEPTHWALGSLPQSIGASVTAGAINIYPASNIGRQYRITCQQESPVFTLESNVVYLMSPDWLEWLILDMAAKIHLRDEELESQAACMAAQSYVQARIVAALQQTARDPAPMSSKVSYR